MAEKHACPVGPEDRTGGGQSPLSGPLRWRAKVILIDSGHLTGDCEHGTCGTGMIVTNDLEFLENFFSLAHLNAKKSTQRAFVNADWPPARRAYASESAISRTPLLGMK